MDGNPHLERVQVVMEWFPHSGYEPTEAPALKRFRRRPDETGWDLWDVDCCVGLRPLRR